MYAIILIDLHFFIFSPFLLDELFAFFTEGNSTDFTDFKLAFSSKEISNQLIKRDNFIYKSNKPLIEFMHIEKRLHIPHAVKESIYRMRSKEISYILCNPKYTCKCFINNINFDDDNYYYIYIIDD